MDPDTGYRLYTPEQLDQARLVAWLRRLGMPLALIRDLAEYLVDHLSPLPRKDTTVLELHHHTRSDRGLIRPTNQDTAYADHRLLAVADGYGTAGDTVSGAAVAALRALDTERLPSGGVLGLLEDAVTSATEAVRNATEGDEDSGTTLTALLWTGSRLGLVHIGDSRAYLLRGTGLFRITHDHSVVQSLLDEGRLTEEEALSHPDHMPTPPRGPPRRPLPSLFRRSYPGSTRGPDPRRPHNGHDPGRRHPRPDRRGQRSWRRGQRELRGRRPDGAGGGG